MIAPEPNPYAPPQMEEEPIPESKPTPRFRFRVLGAALGYIFGGWLFLISLVMPAFSAWLYYQRGWVDPAGLRPEYRHLGHSAWTLFGWIPLNLAGICGILSGRDWMKARRRRAILFLIALFALAGLHSGLNPRRTSRSASDRRPVGARPLNSPVPTRIDQP